MYIIMNDEDFILLRRNINHDIVDEGDAMEFFLELM